MKDSRKKKSLRFWTPSEEESLIKNVDKNVFNLNKAFQATSKEIKRTPTAVAAHWYANTSIKSNHVLFITVSGKHVCINRKNGKGKKSTLPLYKRILAVLGLSY